MRSVRRESRRLLGIAVGTAIAMNESGLAGASKSQLVMEQKFVIGNSMCQGASCRKEIIGGNETFGLGGYTTCSVGKTYGELATPPNEHLFELVYACRRDNDEGETVMSEAECGITSVCLDASTNPYTSEVTYQMAFEFASKPRLLLHGQVDVKLYFAYREVNELLYTAKAKVPVVCELKEMCHRSCIHGEHLFFTNLKSSVGDGWNAGGINLYDHFRIDSHDAVETTTSPDAREEQQASLAAQARKSSYTNTLLGGESRAIPVCLADGEYLYSTEFVPPAAAVAAADPQPDEYGRRARSLTVSEDGRVFSESSWEFCGETGFLAGFSYFRVDKGVCTAIEMWGKNQGKDQGKAQGKDQGKAQGKDEGQGGPAENTPNAAPAHIAKPPPHPTPPPTLDSTDEKKAPPEPASKPKPIPDQASNAPPANIAKPTPTPDGTHEKETASKPTPKPTPASGEASVPKPRSKPTPAETPVSSGSGTPSPEIKAQVAGKIAGDGEEEGSDGESDGLEEREIFAISFGVLGFALLVAFAGTYAQNKGYVPTIGPKMDGDAAGEGTAAPNPDVDEFAP